MRSQKILLYLFLITLCFGRIIPRDRKFFDEQGRQVIFHGANVVVKTPPYIPLIDSYNPNNSFSIEDIKQLRAWGFNGLRLGVMWAGVQTKQAVYNQTYLDRMRDIVNLAGENGIYTLVEFHQDLASQKFCGDGIPAWLINKKYTETFPAPLSKHYSYNQDSGLPQWQDCAKHPWGDYYFSYDVSYTMDALYSNRFNLTDKFIKYWIKVVETFRDNPYVIAYELINEPFAGAIYKNPLLLVPSVSERLKLQHFYDKLSQAIRKVDTTHPLCFEPVTWDNTIPGGFSHPPGGEKYKNESIFCYHFYMPPSLNTKSIKTRVNDGKRLGVTSMVSQFWYLGKNREEIDEFNKYAQSWFFWGYKHFGESEQKIAHKTRSLYGQEPVFMINKDGSLNQAYIEVLSQTYVQRLSGQLINSNYNSITNEYSISYYTRKSAKTVLYLNREINYPKGMSVDIYPKGSLLYTESEPNYLEFSSQKVADGTRVMITIRRL